MYHIIIFSIICQELPHSLLPSICVLYISKSIFALLIYKTFSSFILSCFLFVNSAASEMFGTLILT